MINKERKAQDEGVNKIGDNKRRRLKEKQKKIRRKCRIESKGEIGWEENIQKLMIMIKWNENERKYANKQTNSGSPLTIPNKNTPQRRGRQRKRRKEKE